MNWVLAFLPMGLQILAMQLMSKDKDDKGADDAIGQVILNLTPIIPELMAGRTPTDTATDKVFLALYKTSEAYLAQRGKLPSTAPTPTLTNMTAPR
jgi:hypothetical protein